MPFGLLSTGFVPKTKADITSEMETGFQDRYGTSIRLNPKTSAIGQFIDLVSESLAELWELAEAAVSAMNPDNATGAQLVQVAAITGTTPEPESPSEIVLVLTGVPTTLVPEASRAKTGSTDVEFETLADATIATTTAWATGTAYVVGDIRRTTDSGDDRVYRCTVAGTSLGSGNGPTGTGTAITDNTVTWRYLGDGLGHTFASAESSENGPFEAAAYDVTEIVTPVSGWTSVNNIDPADPGTAVETDAELRIRREDELGADGTSTIDGIRAALIDVDAVTSVTVFQNVTDVTNGDGLPPHSVECLVRGGVEQDIVDVLLASVAAGIATFGDESGIAEDDEGNEHTMYYSRPEEIPIFVNLELIVDPDEFPSDGQDQVIAAIVAYGAAQRTGKNVVSAALKAVCFTIDGVLDVPLCEIGTSGPPSAETTLVITLRQLATFDAGDITIASVTEEDP